MRLLLSFLILSLIASVVFGATPKAIPLWPQGIPGTAVSLAPEADISKPGSELVAGRPVIRLGNVSVPTISIYRPDPAKDTGSAVVVCPGGGYSILAMDLEGTEVCEWLNSIGVTGVLLKYRVPSGKTGHLRSAPFEDAQRALGLVRHQSKQFGIDPHRIGVLGFSAGGHLAANLSNNYATRAYARVDEADDVSCRPDFTILLYPAYLTVGADKTSVAPELQVSAENTPPTFLAMTQDDGLGIETVLFYYLALKNAKVPAELHLYPQGGHGYGLRRAKPLVTTWPDRVVDWMRVSGWLEKTAALLVPWGQTP